MGVTPADLLQEVKAILTPDRFSDDLFKDIEDLPPAVLDTEEDDSAAPSLPIILFSAASGVAGGVIGLYIGYALLGLNAALSAGLAVLAMLFSLGVSGAILSAATRTRGAPVNIVFSCALVILAALFMGVCVLGGALLAALLVAA